MADIPIEGKIKPLLVGGKVADAIDVATAGGSDLETVQANLGNSIISWKFNASVTDATNPGSSFFALNDVQKDDATIISFNVTSNLDSARFTEPLTRLGVGDGIFLQQRDSSNTSIFYRVTGSPTLDGTKVNVPVSRERDQGLEFTDQAVVNVTFFFQGGLSSATRTAGSFVFNSRTVDATNPTTFASSLTGYTVLQGDAFRITTGGEPFAGETTNAQVGDVLLATGATPSLTNADDWLLIEKDLSVSLNMTEAHFLQQVSESDTVVNAADASTEAVFVRFWLRENLVTPGGEDVPGTGLLISEAQNGSFTQSTNSANTILYITIDTTYFNDTGVENLQVEVTNPDGTIAQTLSLNTDFQHETGLAVTGEVFYTTGAQGGTFLRYVEDQVIRLYRIATERHFTITQAPTVTFNQNINDLAESRLSSEVQAKLNRAENIPSDVQFKLNQFVEETTVSQSTEFTGDTTFYYKQGDFSIESSHYVESDYDVGIAPNFDSVKTFTLAIPNDRILTSVEEEAPSGATATPTLEYINISLNSALGVFNIYTVSLPVSVQPYALIGNTATITQINVDPIVKIGSDNFNDALQADFARLHESELSEAMQDLEDHLSVDYVSDTAWTIPPNPTAVRATITRLYAAFWDESRIGSTPFIGNYFEDLPDPTFSVGSVFFYANPDDDFNVNFPGKQSYALPPVSVDSVSTLGTAFTKIIGFSHYISDDAFNEDVPLLKAGTRRILGIGPTGLHVRQGNSDGALVTATFNQRLVSSTSTTTVQYLTGVGASNTVWTVPETNPAGDTLTFPLALTLRIKAADNGVAGTVVTLAYTITDRDVDQAESSHVVAVVPPGGGSRDETLLISYDGTNHQLNVGTAGLALNGPDEITQLGFEITYNDTQQINDSATNTDVAFGEQDEHRGNTVDILLMFEAANPNETSADKFLTVKAIVNGRQENNINLNYRASAYDFSDLQFGPNSGSAVSISNIQVYNWDDGGVSANAPFHSELYQMYLRRQQWLGLFQHPDEDYSRYTIDGGLILTDSDNTEFNIIEQLKAMNRTWQDSGSFTAAATDLSVPLPTDTTLSDFLFIEVTWHTGTGTANDNEHRDYTELGSIAAIINAVDDVLILGGRGRGADNYGIEIKTAAITGSSTSISMDIINLNDTSGATLPTGSLITNVRFL